MLHIALTKDHATYSFDQGPYDFTYVCTNYGMVTLILILPDKSLFFGFLSYLDLGSGR